MARTNPTCYHISASSIAAFKACPQRFRLGYREGIRTDRDTESQRVGTNWHAMHETYANAFMVPCGEPACTPESALNAVIQLLDRQYANVPSWIDAKDWALERQILLTSFIGYLWYWQNDPIEFLDSEVPFNLPVIEPRTGMPLPMSQVQRVGKIDHIIKWNGAVCALERKSTTRGIGSDSDYWEKSRKDTQVSMYALAFQDLIANGQMADHAGPLPLKEGEMMPRIGNTLYDVWHKPTIKPCMLTQAETKAFIETGVYHGQTFLVLADGPAVWVDGESVVVEPGKKAIAIRESVTMFAARLLAEIYERPDFYFVRREIARTAREIQEFRGELFAIYQAMQAFSRGNYWFSNESQCRATYPCPYIAICYGPGAHATCDGVTTPQGYKRIFVDLTVNGRETEQ